MGRNKLSVRKIDNQTSRQVTYSKRKDAIVKKASELSVLCDTDVGLLMFSPTGRFTSFASNGRLIWKGHLFYVSFSYSILFFCFFRKFLTIFLSFGRVEDIFLRFISRPDELKGGYVLLQHLTFLFI